LTRPALVLTATLLAVWLTGCGDSSSRSFALKEPIPLGPYALTVSGVESAPWGGEKAAFIILFETDKPVTEKKFTTHFRRGRFKVTDSNGKRYTPVFVTTVVDYKAEQCNQRQDFESMAFWGQRREEPQQEWVLVFSPPPPLPGSGLTLSIENPDPRQGQAGVARVPLGR